MAVTSKKIEIPIYGYTFTVLIYETPKELYQFFKGVEFNGPVENYDGFVTEVKGKTYVVFKKRGFEYPTPGIIAHEAKHLVNKVFLYIEQELDRVNDEVECYLLSWVVNRIYEVKLKSEKE